MSTTRAKLAATHREVTGKKVARLRRAGQLPAVVFGHGQESRALSLDAHEFEVLQRKIGSNVLVDLSIDGTKPSPVLVHGVQRDPIHHRMLHVDLFAVRMTEELTVDVPLVSVGESAAVVKLGGTLLHVLEHVKVKALPDHLPQAIEFPIDGLIDFDAMIHVRDLVIPGDVTLLTDLDEVVARVQQPRVEELPEEVPTETAGEGAPEAEGSAEAAEPEGDSTRG
jgi:large subunit ribosomal protein L25